MTPEEWAGIVERANRQDMSASAAYRDRRALIALVEEMRAALDFAEREFRRLGRTNAALVISEARKGQTRGTANIGRHAKP